MTKPGERSAVRAPERSYVASLTLALIFTVISGCGAYEEVGPKNPGDNSMEGLSLTTTSLNRIFYDQDSHDSLGIERDPKCGGAIIQDYIEMPGIPGLVRYSRVFYGGRLKGDGARSEAKVAGKGSPPLEYEQNYTYTGRTFIPTVNSVDYGETSDRGIIMQWHRRQGAPVYDIRASNKGFVISSRDRSRKAKKTPVIEMEPGQWVNWVIKARFSTEGNGYFEVFVNGISKFKSENVSNGASLGVRPPYWKYGSYHSGEWNYASGKGGDPKPCDLNRFVVVYHDEMSIYEGFAETAPEPEPEPEPVQMCEVEREQPRLIAKTYRSSKPRKGCQASYAAKLCRQDRVRRVQWCDVHDLPKKRCKVNRIVKRASIDSYTSLKPKSGCEDSEAFKECKDQRVEGMEQNCRIK